MAQDFHARTDWTAAALPKQLDFVSPYCVKKVAADKLVAEQPDHELLISEDFILFHCVNA